MRKDEYLPFANIELDGVMLAKINHRDKENTKLSHM